MGLLSNPVLTGLLAGPERIRAQANQQVASMLPRGGGGMIGAPAAIVRQGGGLSDIGQGLAGLGQGIAAAREAQKQQAMQGQAKASLEKALGIQSGSDAIAQNVSMGGQAGPTVQAAEMANRSNPMNLPAGTFQAARMAYDSGDYMGGLGVIQKTLLSSGDPFTLSQGQTRFDAAGRPIASVDPAPEKVTPTSAQRNAEALGYQPGTPEFADYIRRVTMPSSPTINVSTNLPPQPKKEQEARGTALAARGQAVFDAAQKASAQIPALQMALTISDTAESGDPLPSALQERAGTLLQGLGFDVENGPFSKVLGNITSGQAFNAIMQNAVLTKMQAQAGPQTESDTRLIRQTVANLGNTPEARNFLLRSAMSLAQRDVDKSAFYEDYWAENGTYDGAERAWSSRMGRVPLFGVNPNTKLPVFFSEFKEGVRAANPDANLSDQEIQDLWVKKYGRNR